MTNGHGMAVWSRGATSCWLACVMISLTGCGGAATNIPAPDRDALRSQSSTNDVGHSTTIRYQARPPGGDLPFAYENGEDAERSSILEGMGGGVAIFDFDRDGWPDLLFPGGGNFNGQQSLTASPPGFYRNLGAWNLVPCATAAGLSTATHYSLGTAIGDFDNDGFEDVLITGYGGLQLLHNQGDGTFTDVTTSAMMDDRLWSTSAAWGDLNGDGNLDLYVAHYVDWSFDNDPNCPTVDGRRRERCPPQRYGPLPDVIYLSSGNGIFADSSRECGLRRDGKGLGVVLADLDLDGDLDIYVANDTVENFLYRNDGHARFEEIAVAAGCAFNDTGAPDGSMGVAVADYNLDGRPDIWVVNYERETIGLYKNLGDRAFEHVSQSTGVSVVGTMFVGFGTVFLDADLDGDEDVFVANGHVLRFPNNAPVRQLPLFFENLAGKRFLDVASQTGAYGRETHIGRGVAHGDIDNDGDLDLAISDLRNPVSIEENISTARGQWLKVRLIGIASNRDAIGTRLTLTTSAGTQVRQVSSGDSYLSHSDRIPHWGVPLGATLEQLSITWPNGQSQTILRPALNQTLTVHQPVE